MNCNLASSSLSVQQLVGAAERLMRGGKSHTHAVDWLSYVEQARDRLAQRPFRGLSQNSFTKNIRGKIRTLLITPQSDRLISEALLPLLERKVEQEAPNSVHGYRSGRSTFTAVINLREALQTGYYHIFMSDIKSFFPSIDRSFLMAVLEKYFSERLTEIIMALIKAPVRGESGTTESISGLPLGLPLSPSLSNLFLLPLDKIMEKLPVKYLRYGDDLLLAAQGNEDLKIAIDQMEIELAKLGLNLNKEKTRSFVYDGTPFHYLGHVVSAEAVYEALSSARIQRLQNPPPSSKYDNKPGEPTGRTRTLYITESPAYIKVQQGQLVCLRGSEILREIPLHRLDRILIMSGASFSSGFVAECVKRQIQVLFFIAKGRTYGSLVGEGIANPLRLRAQYDLRSEPSRRLEIARSILDAKFQAMIIRLVKADPEGKRRQAIEGYRKALASTDDIGKMMGMEGQATSTYYRGFASRIKVEAFAYKKRSKRPPRDAINSLLSFTYSLIFGEMQTTLLAHGLDPCPGFLHELHRNHPALASDMIEPYRSLVADSFVLTLINQHIVQEEGFVRQSNGAVYMSHETRKTVLSTYENFMSKSFGGKTDIGSPRRLLHSAARAMLRLVLGEEVEFTMPLKAEESTLEENSIEVIGQNAPVPDEFVYLPEKNHNRMEELNVGKDHKNET